MSRDLVVRLVDCVEAPAGLLTHSFVMLLLSLLVLGCSSVGSRQLSPDTMRTLINGDQDQDTGHIPQVYHQLRTILSLPDSIRSMGNTARPLILNPVLG